jgi:hypothetical protein
MKDNPIGRDLISAVDDDDITDKNLRDLDVLDAATSDDLDVSAEKL